MSAELPKFTIVTPSLNQAAYLERTIRSVVDQDYPNLEYFVMDAGSTDGSVDIIKRYEHRIDHWVSAPDGGQAAAINAGWTRGSGEIVAWLNSDDYYLPGSLRWVADYMTAHPDAWVVYGQCEFVDPQGNRLVELGWPYVRREMVFSRQLIPQPAAFIRREAIDKVGLLDARLHYVMDYDLFLRIGLVRDPVFVARPLAGATGHPETKTATGRSPMARERWVVRLRHARTREKPFLLVGRAASSLLHRLPTGVMGLIDRARRLSPATGSRSSHP